MAEANPIVVKLLTMMPSAWALAVYKMGKICCQHHDE